jgi:hypothetical protein
MKLSKIVLAGAFVLTSTYAFAQAGEGDAGYSGGGGGGYSGGYSGYAQMPDPGYGAYGYSRGYGAVIHPGRWDRGARWDRRYDRR